VRPDVVLVCDTERAADGVPAVALSQRGRIDAEIVVDTGGVPVHPGRLGGAVPDPSLVLLDVLAGLRAAVDRIPAPAGAGWSSRPVLSVTRLAAGETGAGGALPVRARARIDIRLPPKIDAGATAGTLGRVVGQLRPDRVSVTMNRQSRYSGMVFDPPVEVLAALDRACRKTFGAPLRYLHSGGSLPVAAQLETVFGTPPVLLGLGTPGGGAHGPDERLDLAGWSAGVDLLRQFFAIVASFLSILQGSRS
jgi:succinyl-diaminopimelate desuccinylase